MIIGLTGGIGSGKSTVAGMFRDLGISVVDADQVARDVVMPGSHCLQAITDHYGTGIIKNGELDRVAMRERIFNNPAEKKWLEDLLHPVIRKEMLHRLTTSDSIYSILEAPLLYENGLQSQCTKTILVDIPELAQIVRTSSRDKADRQAIQKIIDAQMSRDEKRKLADYILDNSNDLDNLHAQVLRLDQILRLLATNSEFQ